MTGRRSSGARDTRDTGSAYGASRPGLVQPGLHGPDRDVQLGGHLAVAEALQVEQEHRLPLPVGEACDRRPDPGREVGQLGELVRSGAVAGAVGPGRRPFRAELAEPAPRDVQGYAAEPGTEPVGAAQPVQTGHRRHHGLLDGVPGQVLGAEHAGRERRGGGLVPAYQLGERLPGAGQRPADQVCVRGRAVPQLSHAL